MTQSSIRTVLLIFVSVLLGAALYASLVPDGAQAETKPLSLIKTYQIGTARTVAVNTTGNRLVFISGQTGMDAQRKMSDDIGEQAEQALKNIDQS